MRLQWDRGPVLCLPLSFMCGQGSSRTGEMGLPGPFPVGPLCSTGTTAFPTRLCPLLQVLPSGTSVAVGKAKAQLRGQRPPPTDWAHPPSQGRPRASPALPLLPSPGRNWVGRSQEMGLIPVPNPQCSQRLDSAWSGARAFKGLLQGPEGGGGWGGRRMRTGGPRAFQSPSPWSLWTRHRPLCTATSAHGDHPSFR